MEYFKEKSHGVYNKLAGTCLRENYGGNILAPYSYLCVRERSLCNSKLHQKYIYSKSNLKLNTEHYPFMDKIYSQTIHPNVNEDFRVERS